MAARGGPLLATDPAVLDARLAAFLGSIRPGLTQVFIYGGTAAISSGIQEDLDELLTG